MLQHSVFGLTVILFSCSTYLLGRSNSIKDEIKKDVSVYSPSKNEPEQVVILEPKERAKEKNDNILHQKYL